MRFVRRNFKYLLTVLILVIIAGAGIATVKISSIEAERQIAKEEANSDIAMAKTNASTAKRTGGGNNSYTMPASDQTTNESSDDKSSGVAKENFDAQQNDADSQAENIRKDSRSNSKKSVDAEDVDGQSANDKQAERNAKAKTSGKDVVLKAKEKNGSKAQKASEPKKEVASSGRKKSNGKNSNTTYHTAKVPENKPEPVNVEDQTIEEDTSFTVYLSIECLTLLNKKDSVEPSVAKYIPEDGYILRKKECVCYKGESVYDVLAREVKAAGIQFEADYTPMYGSAYIRGIGNIYEFDGGDMSGWLYSVKPPNEDAWCPNYGCSRYVLIEGEYIRWAYTCENFGGDIGGEFAGGF